jgi:hypothetical protein
MFLKCRQKSGKMLTSSRGIIPSKEGERKLKLVL